MERLVTSAAPAISVVMGVYNGADLVERAIESLKQQTFADWELVIIDDCSTDATPAVLQRLTKCESRIRLIRNAENLGCGAAKNAGLSVARGEYIAYLDHDDEYYPDFLAHAAKMRGKADVLAFAYDVVELDEQGNQHERTWVPASAAHELFFQNISTPIGLVHRRTLLDQVGYFNELLFLADDTDMWRRLARSGASFAFLAVKSGRYYVRAESLSRTHRLSPRQRTTIEANWRAGRPLFGAPPPGQRRTIRKIAFVSQHALLDSTSGAAIATSDALRFLSRLGFECQAFCTTHLDSPDEVLLEEVLAQRKMPYEARRAKIGPGEGRLIFTRDGQVPMTFLQRFSTRTDWTDPLEAEMFLAGCKTFLQKNRPDAVITYGGDPISVGLFNLIKSLDIPIVFGLHNFEYHDPATFRVIDRVAVPSRFARQYYWDAMGLAAYVLPNVIDPARVVAKDRSPKYVTFVNPELNKGVLVFARIAAELVRRRPEIPLLVVCGRGSLAGLVELAGEMGWQANLTTMPNTPDPREFYRHTRLLLMPSLWRESSPLVPAEAMCNGIPVIGSTRGGVPETVGNGGVLLDIPAQYTPDTTEIPSASEVEPWVETILRLWDDASAYQQAVAAALARAQHFQPERLAEYYKSFFGSLFPQSSPPIIPR